MSPTRAGPYAPLTAPAPYQLQAAFAAVHDEAETMDGTDWPQLLGLYDLLELAAPSPFTTLNRAVAADLLDTPRQDKRMAKHRRLFAARAHLLGLAGEPAEAYAQAARLSTSTPECRYLATQAKRYSDGDCSDLSSSLVIVG